MKHKLTYNIAGHRFEIVSSFPDQLKKMLYGFAPFLTEETDNQIDDPILQFMIEDAQISQRTPFRNIETTIIHSFDIEDGKCTLRKSGTNYFFEIEEKTKIISKGAGIKPVSLTLEMETDSSRIHCTYDAHGSINPNYLKFALWIATAFVGIPQQTVALHSSVIISDNRAILFLGESGTGKSTHTGLWLNHISGSYLLNDDSPIIRMEQNEANEFIPYVYGSPWSGKGQCYRNERHPVAAFVRLQQHKINQITQLSKLESFGALYPSFPPAFLKDNYFEEHICSIISVILRVTPVYRLQCLPDFAAAQLVRTTVFNERHL